MDSIQKSEFEVIRYEKLRHLHILLVDILFRNMHEHSEFEIDTILSGSAKIRCRDREIDAGAGTILLFNPYEPHEIASNTTEPVRILSMQISNHFCKEYYPYLRNVEFRPTAVSQSMTGEDCDAVRTLIFTTSRCFLREEQSFQFDCVGMVSLLFSRLLASVPYQLIDDQEYAVRKRKTARIRRITGYIDQHYKEKIMLPDLADMEGITTTYLSHFFHDTFHMTFQEYVNKLRLEKALILMKDSSLYLVDICMECGFSDNKYLNRMFLKQFGCSASEYRRNKVVPASVRSIDPQPESYSESHFSQKDSLAFLEQYIAAHHEPLYTLK